MNVPGMRVGGGKDWQPRITRIGNRTRIRPLRRSPAWLDVRHLLDPHKEDGEGTMTTLPGSQRWPEVTHA